MSERDTDRSVFSELKIREASIDDHIIADCPLCLDPMLLGELWRDLILNNDRDIPECPDCDDGTGDSWSDDADVKLDGAEFWALSGDVIKTVRPAFDDTNGDDHDV